MTTLIHLFTALSVLSVSTTAAAHVSLEDPQAEAGKNYEAVFRVGHGCEGASSTTALSVRIPAGVGAVQARPKTGWTLAATPDAVTWTAQKDAALPSGQRGEFALAATLAQNTGPLWFKVTQTCGKESVEWADIPSSGTSTAGMKTPAVLLEVMSPAQLATARAMPKVEGAWVRGSVTGQQSSGAFMRLTAREPMKLVGASSPVAGSAEVHEMKMEGDVMRMRPAGQLELPAGQTVELKPGGFHLMLLDLKQPLAKDTMVPLTLVLRNAKGVESKLELKLPVAMQAPGAPPAGAASAAAQHKH